MSTRDSETREAARLLEASQEFARAGRHEEALQAVRTAVDWCRRLVGQDDSTPTRSPAGVRANLAAALNNESNRLADVGRYDEALRSIREAVEIRRALASGDPASYAPELAESLNNLSVLLATVGDHQESLAFVEESVEIRRKLAAEGRGSYLPALASSVTNRANRLAEVGRLEEALRTGSRGTSCSTLPGGRWATVPRVAAGARSGPQQ
jgi:tetratricopeptide (TPR) repeat protein